MGAQDQLYDAWTPHLYQGNKGIESWKIENFYRDLSDRVAAMWQLPFFKGKGEEGVLQGDHLENLINP